MKKIIYLVLAILIFIGLDYLQYRFLSNDKENNNQVIIKNINDCEDVYDLEGISLCEFFHPGRINQDLDVDYSIAYVVIAPGQSIGSHKINNAEVHYIIEGKEIIYINDEPIELEQGQIIYIPPKAKQSSKNIGDVDLKFFAINQPAWSEENEELINE